MLNCVKCQIKFWLKNPGLLDKNFLLSKLYLTTTFFGVFTIKINNPVVY
jgi:hypothetical protein